MSLDPEKRERILDAAARRFAHYGFKKTSIDEIAREARVGKGTVYLVCRTKEELLYQVARRELAAWNTAVEGSIDPSMPAELLLVKCSTDAFGYLDTHPIVRDLLLGNLEEVLPLWVEQIDDLREIGRGYIRQILNLGVAAGTFRGDLDIDAVARMLQDMHAMALVLNYRERRPLSEQIAAAGLALDVLLRGLLAR